MSIKTSYPHYLTSPDVCLVSRRHQNVKLPNIVNFELLPRRSLGDGGSGVVRDRGLEPIEALFFMFSSLIIFAFLCANLYSVIQAFPLHSKHFLASLCNYRQKNLCGIVRLCGNCAEFLLGPNLCENCAGGRYPLAGGSKAAPWAEYAPQRPLGVNRDQQGQRAVWLVCPPFQTTSPSGNQDKSSF
jgi:hypothetical protein